MSLIAPGLLSLAGLIALIEYIRVQRESRRRLAEYSKRQCTGQLWRERFPDISNEEFRRFLDLFVNSFGFENKDRLKFGPDDKIMDAYRALYPSEGWADALELESLADKLQREYGFDLAAVQDPHVTLGELFSRRGPQHQN